MIFGIINLLIKCRSYSTMNRYRTYEKTLQDVDFDPNRVRIYLHSQIPINFECYHKNVGIEDLTYALKSLKIYFTALDYLDL